MLLTRTDTALSGEALWDLAIQLPRRQRAKRVEEDALENVGVPGREDYVASRLTRAGQGRSCPELPAINGLDKTGG